MRQLSKQSDTFDLLRARVESTVSCPAVIAITSTSSLDRQTESAHNLSLSLAKAGYQTLFIDGTASADSARFYAGLSLAEVSERTSRVGKYGLRMVSFTDPAIQECTGQAALENALQTYRTQYDYIVIEAERGLTTSFATYIIRSADAVLATIQTGRRQRSADAKMSATLKALGSRFIGVIAVNRNITDEIAPNRSALVVKQESGSRAGVQKPKAAELFRVNE